MDSGADRGPGLATGEYERVPRYDGDRTNRLAIDPTFGSSQARLLLRAASLPGRSCRDAERTDRRHGCRSANAGPLRRRRLSGSIRASCIIGSHGRSRASWTASKKAVVRTESPTLIVLESKAERVTLPSESVSRCSFPVAFSGDGRAYDCAYRLASRGRISPQFVAAMSSPICSIFQPGAATCNLYGRTFNPKAAGSNPARPMRFAGILSIDSRGARTCVRTRTRP
jgi:hypothetical protein